MQLQAIWFFMVMDQTNPFKEASIFFTWLLLLSVTVNHWFPVTGCFLLPSSFAASYSWGPLASCIPQLSTLSFLQCFELIHLGCLFPPFPSLNLPLSTPPNLFFHSGSGTLRRSRCPLFFACIQFWVLLLVKSLCIWVPYPSFTSTHSPLSWHSHHPPGMLSLGVFYLFITSWIYFQSTLLFPALWPGTCNSLSFHCPCCQSWFALCPFSFAKQ